MKRKPLLVILAICYEAFRALVYLIFDFDTYTELLPLTWYISIFSLALPAILAYFAMTEDGTTWTWCFTIVSCAQNIGVVKYLIDRWQYTNIVFENYLRNDLLPLVSFLMIDAILIVILFFIHKDNERKDINADNSSSER